MMFIFGILLLPCVFSLRLFNKYNSDNFASRGRPCKLYNPPEAILSNKYNTETDRYIGLLNIVVVIGCIECYSLSYFLKMARPDLNIPSL